MLNKLFLGLLKFSIFRHFLGPLWANEFVTRSRHPEFSQTYPYYQVMLQDALYLGMTFISQSNVQISRNLKITTSRP